jgi:predicted MFS family arabinose efflux permease
MPPMFADRHVLRVVAARFISRVGGEAAFFVGIWGKAAFELEADAGEIALVMAALGISSLIGTSIAGLLVDRFDPRRVLIGAEFVFVPVVIGMVFADTLPALTVMVFFVGLVGAPVFTAISSFGPYLTENPDRLGQVNGYIEGASWSAFVVGPAVGAVLAGTVGIDAIFILDAATSIVAAILVFGVTVRQLRTSEERGGNFSELKNGFKFTYGHRRLRFYILLGSTVWIMFGTFSSLEALFFRDVLGVEIETLGWVNSIFGLGLVGGTWVASRLPSTYRTARSLAIVVAMTGLGSLLYVGTDRLGIVVAAGVVWGSIIGMMAPLHRTLIQLNSPDEFVGRIAGVTHIHSEVGHLMPLAIAPPLAAAFGIQRTLIAAGLLVALVAVAAIPAANRLDRTRIVEVPPTGLPDPLDEPKSVSH